jgi:hypothetical protein
MLVDRGLIVRVGQGIMLVVLLTRMSLRVHMDRSVGQVPQAMQQAVVYLLGNLMPLVDRQV